MVSLNHSLQQAEDGCAELGRCHTEMLLRQVGNVADRADRRLDRLDRQQCRFVFLDGFFYLKAGNRIGFGDVGADQEEHVRLRDVLKRHGPAMRALHQSHGLHPVDMAVPRAAIEVIGSDREAHEFLEQIEFFVGTAAGNQSAEGLRAMRQLEPAWSVRPQTPTPLPTWLRPARRSV